MLKNSILSSISGQDSKLYVDDVFSTWLRTGTGADVTVTTGIDMTKGYCLWSKGRSGATDHAVYHSARGVTLDLATNTTAGQTTQATGLKAISATGHTVGSLAKMNTSGATYSDWIFRNADQFYSHQVATKSAGSNATISFANLGALGMVRVKRTDSTGSWYIWHRSLSAGQLLIGETTAAAATLGHVTVSGATVTLVNGVIADGTYLVEAFAHDSSADGIIQCGTFTTDGSGNASVNLGWEPQYLMLKRSNGTLDWRLVDSMRGLNNSGENILAPNTSDSEIVSGTASTKPTATGFTHQGNTSATYVYLAIRRPNKPPTTGTQVYNAIARTGTGAAATVTGVGFAPDLTITRKRSSDTTASFTDRLRGSNNFLQGAAVSGELKTWTDTITSFASMDGVVFGADSSVGYFNSNGNNFINHFIRRAPGFMDVVCDTGTGAAHAITHNLTKAPELLIRKSRSAATQWEVWHSALAATEKLVLNSTAAKTTDTTAWNSTAPTATQFTVGTGANVNANAATFVTYLFATLTGISKVGSYTGNGGTQTIDCGFSTGARFIMCKRTDSTGDWYIWDSVRGIVSANDPHLSLNTMAVEVTTDDSVDPASQGFSVNQNTATNINVNAASYIFLAIA